MAIHSRRSPVNFPGPVVFAVALALASATGASADSLNVVAGDSTWHAFQTPSTAGLPGAAFWNNSSYDGANRDCNIGYWLSGLGGCSANGGTFYNSSPRVTPPYLGDANTRFGFAKDAASSSVTVTTQVQTTAWYPGNEFGWYQVNNPTQLFPLFGLSLPADGTATFVPSGDYGFYITSRHGTYLSDRTQGTQSHFAVFKLAGNGHYMVGSEDMWYGSDWDYNDMVLNVQINEVPEPVTLVLVGTGLLGLLGRRNRGRSVGTRP